MRNRTDCAGLRRALRLSDWKPDIVVTASVLGHAVGHLLARKARALHIASEHSSTPQAAERLGRDPMRRLVARRADGVIAVTERQMPYLAKLGYRLDRIRVVWNGISDVRARGKRNDIRAELGLRDDDFVAGLVASLRPEKRADLFVEAVSRAHAVDPKIRGFIAGGGPELGRIRELAATSNGAVQVLGDRSDVPDLMIAADAVCLTSDAEALPMVVLEAMALGCPVIATNVGGIPDLVVQGETGVLIPPGDVEALVRTLLDCAAQPERLETYAARARERQRQFFTRDRMVREYGKVFREFVTDVGPPA
jgi:glycosyltransferase involved in cell wall biosynthesis